MAGFGDILGLLEKGLTSGPANDIGFMGQWGSKIGQFFGWVDPKTKNMIDFARSAQEYAEHKMTRADLEDKGVQDVANWMIASNLEAPGPNGEPGWSPEMATIVAGIGSKILGMLAMPLVKGADHAISGAVDGIRDKITGGQDATPVAPGGSKPSAAHLAGLPGHA